jgi:hypothetical protein
MKIAYISGTKKREYLKIKLMNLKQTARTRISEAHIGTSMTKKAYQPRSNTTNHKKGDLIAASYSIMYCVCVCIYIYTHTHTHTIYDIYIKRAILDF